MDGASRRGESGRIRVRSRDLVGSAGWKRMLKRKLAVNTLSSEPGPEADTVPPSVHQPRR